MTAAVAPTRERQEPTADPEQIKHRVAAFWEERSCGEVSALGASVAEQLDEQARVRYSIEPYLPRFARFREGAGLSVLEVGVGMGADHLEWAKARPAHLAGIDLTRRAVDFTRERLRLNGVTSDVRIGDAEALPYGDATFDLVWSWGVLHHSASPEACVREIHRVLRPGGRARVMLYHRGGIVFRLLWVRHALLRGRPGRSLDDVIWHQVESFATKAYTPASALALFGVFSSVTVRPVLTMGDLIEGPIGRRNGGIVLSVLKRVWPRWLVRPLGGNLGSDLLIEATK